MSNVDRLAQTTRFAVVGVLNTGVDITAFSLLFYVFETQLLVANSIGYLAAVSHSFALNKYWTFKDTRHQGRIHHQFALFLAFGLIGLGLSNGCVWLLASYVPEIAAKLMSVGILFLWNYATSRIIVFNAKEH